MKTRMTLMIGLLGFHLAAWAQPQDTTDFEYYRVRSGESVETIASSRGLRADALRQINPILEHVVFPEEGTVIFVPPRQAPPRRSLSARSGKVQPQLAPPAAVERVERVASLAPRPSQPSPRPSASGSGLSEAEIDAIFDSLVKPLVGSVPRIEPAFHEPQHHNVVVTSDGRTLAVPQAAPRRVKKVEKSQESIDISQLTPRGQKVHRLLKSSLSYMGVPYVWGGADPSGMDCSGFVQKVYTDHGIRMPRTADLQFEVGQVVPRGQEQPGDLVYFETYCPGASHVGVYLGRSQFVHASSGAGYITIGDLRDDYFSRCYLGARRNW